MSELIIGQDEGGFYTDTGYVSDDVAVAQGFKRCEECSLQANNIKDKHTELREILQKYNCVEWGDIIIDEICNLFDYPPTTEEGE